MQNDYISREAAISLLHYNTDEACSAVVADFEALPAADVRPVVRAKWECIPLNMNPNYFAYKYNLRKKCTACAYVMPDEYPDFKICPNCGAQMRKGERNEKTCNENDSE